MVPNSWKLTGCVQPAPAQPGGECRWFSHCPWEKKNPWQNTTQRSVLYFICTVKEKEDLHPDPEAQSIKDEIFGEYR